MSQLDKLAQHRDAILLAEIGAWLHDDFKHTDQQIHMYVSHAPSPSSRQDTADLIPNIDIDFLGKKLKLIVVKNRKQDDFVDGYLNRCHYTAHIEKEDGNSQQTYPAFLSSPFGFEAFQIPEKLTDSLRNRVPWNLIDDPTTNRANFQKQLRELFSQVGGDTRRPSNEITLWEWGHTVGALYKAALIGAYFQQEIGLTPIAANDLRWRLLGVRTDALAYLTNVSRLPDLVARQNTLQVAINNVQTFLEEIYPLATEVYRDENGSLYVVPDLPKLLNLQDDRDQTLLTLIQQQFATDGEIIPQITLDPTAWWGQDPDRRGNDEIPPAGIILSSQTRLQSDANAIGEAWKDTRQEVCPICGLRPCVNKQLDYCQVCGERRKGRVVEWLQDPSKTIWLDEVADENGRLVLITGTFNLTNWLDGSLVQTLLVQEPTASNLAVTKTSSFARLRRVWQTTQTFWQETQAHINQMLADARRRLTIKLANQPSLTKHHVYELNLLGHTRMSVLWDGAGLISTDNLSYTAVQLNIKLEEHKTPADAALAVGAWLEGNKQRIFQLVSDDEKNQRFDIQIADVSYQDTSYSTTIPILAEPRTFMALVPADKALAVIEAIKTKYAREMGKVRNRLPLHLGAVYFHRRTPLRAALDAGRRMLQQKPLGGDQLWSVIARSPTAKHDLPGKLVDGTKQFDQTISIQLKQNDRAFTWHVPAVMGDGQTEDNWYPYVFVQNDVSGRSRIFKGLRPKSDGTSEECWLVHAAELQTGDQITFTPATFDFQWLDSSGSRFEIAYDDAGQRLARPTHPYLLDDLATIQQVWQVISSMDGLTSSQIYALRDLVEAKRATWAIDDSFSQFCRHAVRNAQWKNRQAINLEQIVQATVSGLLTDVIELYMGIMKAKPQRQGEEV